MKNASHLVAAMWILILPSVALAEKAKPIEIDTTQLSYAAAQSALPPGARIVAGNPARNEFYIIGRKTTPPMQMAENHPAVARKDEKGIAHIRVALQKMLVAKKHELPPVAIAAKQTPKVKTKVASKTDNTKVKTKVANKTDMTKTKLKVANHTGIAKTKTKVLMSAVKSSHPVLARNKALPVQLKVALKKEDRQHLLGLRDNISKNLLKGSLALGK